RHRRYRRKPVSSFFFALRVLDSGLRRNDALRQVSACKEIGPTLCRAYLASETLWMPSAAASRRRQGGTRRGWRVERGARRIGHGLGDAARRRRALLWQAAERT